MNDAQTDAAYTFVDSVLSKADHHRWGAPLWHGWALRDAFAAGCHWQAQQSAPPTLAQIAASPEVRALVEAATDAQEALISAMEEIVELRLTLGKSDLEPPWLSDAIDQSRAALAAFKAMEAGK